MPTDEAFDRAVGQQDRLVAGMLDVGGAARTTVAWTNGVLARRNCCARSSISSLPHKGLPDRWRAGPAASHTRDGVSGMSACRIPNGANASTTAFTTAGGEPTVADSPIPFAPIG